MRPHKKEMRPQSAATNTSATKCSSYVRKKERTPCVTQDQYGAATISRLLKIVGLFCKRAL